MLVCFYPSQGQEEKGNSWLCTIHGYSEWLSAMLWFRGCPCRWCSILSDSVPLGVMVEFILVSPIWDCTRGNRQGPDSASLPQEFCTNVAKIPCPMIRACCSKPCCGCKPVPIWLLMVVCPWTGELSSTLHPLSQLWTLYFCSPLGALNFFSAYIAGGLCMLVQNGKFSLPGKVLWHQEFPQQALTGCFAAGIDHPLLPWQA